MVPHNWLLEFRTVISELHRTITRKYGGPQLWLWSSINIYADAYVNIKGGQKSPESHATSIIMELHIYMELQNTSYGPPYVIYDTLQLIFELSIKLSWSSIIQIWHSISQFCSFINQGHWCSTMIRDYGSPSIELWRSIYRFAELYKSNFGDIFGRSIKQLRTSK